MTVPKAVELFYDFAPFEAELSGLAREMICALRCGKVGAPLVVRINAPDFEAHVRAVAAELPGAFLRDARLRFVEHLRLCSAECKVCGSMN
ncbi:MAG: hypothetical protein WCB68_16365 [Pyrinomonadaceae bacterium]